MAATSTQLIKDERADFETLEEIMGMFWNATIRVKDVNVQKATRIGDNFISDAWRIKFKHFMQKRPRTDTTAEIKNDVCARKYTPIRRDGVFQSVFVKTRPDDEKHNKIMHTDIAFKNEILAYETILEALDKYANGNLRVPTYVYGNPTTIVLEDMTNRFFVSMSRKFIDSWDRLWSPVQEMAKLHAASIVMQKLNGDQFRDMINLIAEVPLSETTVLKNKQASVIDTIVLLLEEEKYPKAEEYSKILLALKDEAWEKQRDIINEKTAVMVVNHGNFWVNNLLYHNSIAMLLDWQHVVYSSPATDLCFFLYVNLCTSLLKKQRKDILEYYLMHLHQCIFDVCNEKNVDSSEIEALIEPLTYDWIDKEMRRCSLCGYMMAQWINPIFYWVDTDIDKLVKKGGMENLSVEKRLDHMTEKQKIRAIELTKIFINEYKSN